MYKHPLTAAELNDMFETLAQLPQAVNDQTWAAFVRRIYHDSPKLGRIVTRLRGIDPDARVTYLVQDLALIEDDRPGHKALVTLLEAAVAELGGSAAAKLQRLVDKHSQNSDGGGVTGELSRPKLSMSEPAPAQPVVPAQPSAFLTELLAVRHEIGQMRQAQRAEAIQLYQAIRESQDELAGWREELVVWSQRALADAAVPKPEVAAQVTALGEANASVSGYWQAAIPVIPGILTYYIESGNTLGVDLKNLLGRIKRKVLGRGFGSGAAPIDPPSGPGDAYAFLVGVNHYEDSGIRSLRQCVGDAAALAALLKSSYREVRLLTDTAQLPTRDAILGDFAVQAFTTKADDTLLFYFSGHGLAENGTVYLLPRNARRVNVAPHAVDLADIRKIFDDKRCAAKKLVLILDACHGGAELGKGDETMSAEFMRNVYHEAQGVVTLAACAQHELAYEDPVLGHGVFTCALLEALGGLADWHGKGFVSAEDCEIYVVDRVKTWARSNNCVQTPTMQKSGSGHLVVNRYVG